MCYRHEGTTQRRVISPRLLFPADVLALWHAQQTGGPTKWRGVNLKSPISGEMTNAHRRHIRVARDLGISKIMKEKGQKDEEKKKSWKRHSICRGSKNHYEVLKTDGNTRCAQSCSTCEASTAASEPFI